jgi:DNA repair protein RadC
LKPSEADFNLTNNMNDAGKLQYLPNLDHLIISDQFYYSFTDEGMVKKYGLGLENSLNLFC